VIVAGGSRHSGGGHVDEEEEQCFYDYEYYIEICGASRLAGGGGFHLRALATAVVLMTIGRPAGLESNEIWSVVISRVCGSASSAIPSLDTLGTRLHYWRQDGASCTYRGYLVQQ